MARNSTRETGTEILASVMKQHRTVYDLMDMLGTARRSVDGWTKQFHRSGIFYIAGWQRSGNLGPPYPIYGMQPRPYLMEDAPRPARIGRTKRNA